MNPKHDKAAVPQVYVCPMCGNDQWVGLGQETGAEVIVPTPLRLGEVDEHGQDHAILGMACTVCGFIRLHSLDALGKGQ